MREKAVYDWFIEPGDKHTNEVIASESPGEEPLRNVLCGDGIRRNLWQCSFRFIRYFKNSQKSAALRFEVFNRRKPNGAIRKCPLFELERKKEKLRKKVRKKITSLGED